MKVVDLGIVSYEKCNAMLEHYLEVARSEDHLLLCQHPAVYTVGSEPYPTDLEVVQTDRGGSITYFDEGCLMVYFAFAVPSPARFYSKVLRSLQRFFSHFDQNIFYDRKRPGFYIQNRKIASLGFRYKNGMSKHGVSLHINPDLQNFNKIEPCGLQNVQATSLYNEGYAIAMQEAKSMITKAVLDEFRQA